ncbi:MAG: hypothetical protein KDK45_13960, partial [Leptospiraceae bacterium]|nr:hypothetical protein [Leptospiraceae bacterium]
LKTLFKEFFIQGRVLPYIFILASVLAIVCRFLPLQFSILFIRLLNLSTFVLVSFFFLEWSRFWLLNPALKMDENRISHILTDLAGNMTLLIVFGMFYFHLENLLKQKKRESYHVPFASPLFYFSILPLSTLEPAILYLYILSLTVYFVWTREILSIYYGNSSYKIIERVEEEGKLNITELLKLFPVGERRLYELISSMEGELIIKKEENMVYSPSALQFEEGHRLCRNCGAYNELNTGNIITCPYCEVEYHKSISEKKKKKPIPVVVETFSYIVNMFKFPVLTWGLTFMLVGITSEASSRDGDIFLGIFLGGGIFALSVYISIMYIEVLAKQLIEGKRYMTAMLINIFLLFLFVPLYYLRKLNTKRALYHFDELEKNEIQNYINKNKDISIPEFAKFLQVSDSEAYDFARYLSQNNLISSVYDRQKNRLINKQLFQRSSGEKSCVHCGGKYSILQGKAVCQYCGHIRN